jgi:hypothetical protein
MPEITPTWFPAFSYNNVADVCVTRAFHTYPNFLKTQPSYTSRNIYYNLIIRDAMMYVSIQKHILAHQADDL